LKNAKSEGLFVHPDKNLTKLQSQILKSKQLQHRP